MRVCVIYDDRDRPETTGGYCLRALRELGPVTHARPDQFGALSPADFDLFVRVDDGLEYPVPGHLRPLAWWAIDTHLEFDRCLAQARAADLTFAAQKPGAEALRAAGVAGAEWLPLACDPGVHRPHEVPVARDWCFVGNPIPGPRTELLELLRRHLPNHFAGRAYFDDMARAYSGARVAFNRSVRDDLNMRVFEALACGTFLVTNALPPGAGQDELLRDGTHLATYAGPEDLLDKVRFYLARPEARDRVARAGRAEVAAKHTYRHRMARILATSAARARSVPVRDDERAGAAAPVQHKPAPFDPGYFEFDRPELLALVPRTATDVVDVGCGAGRFGAGLKARQPCRVVGIEHDPVAAAAARGRLDLVLEGDAEALDWPFPAHSFDAVVCGDVLEHLRDPLAFLKRVRTWLRPDGVLVTSLPNVRHHSVVRGLLDGDWTYEPAGLLDHTHLRFFTRREVEKILFRAGFAVPDLVPVPGPGYEEWDAAGRPGTVTVGGLRVGGLDPADAEEFYAYQWLGAARPEPRPDPGVTSVVILTHNQLRLTRACVNSIRLLTDEPYELVFVDNGSTDGTPAYLTGLAAADPRVRVVLNPENRGFPAGCNQGIRVATGAQVLLLNNDTVVTAGWLTRLLRALRSGPDVGLAGPCSNHVSGDQQVPVTYPEDTLDGLDGFAWRHGRAHDGRAGDTDRLVGFCLLIKRAVIGAVGGLDEGFGLGNFEDDDYCRRARGAGFRAVIARDAFVHHVGGATFRATGVDYVGLMRANRDRFHRKWDTPAPAEPLPAAPAPGSGEPAPRVLALAHVALFRDRMDKSHYFRYRALAARPGVTLFGPGLPGYRPGMSLGEAVATACGGHWPEVVVHGCDPHASGVPLVTGLAEAPVPTALELQDSWAFEDRHVAFIREHRFTAVLIQEAGHHVAFYRDRCPDAEFVWTPNAVDTGVFRDRGLDKEYDIIVYGALNPEVYPLRARVAGLLERQSEFRVLRVPHPGYYPEGAAAAGVVSGEALSRAINRAWLGLATQSIYRCFLMKYLELAASGALVAGDVPDHARDVFGTDFVELGLGDPDEVILGKLREALKDKDRLRGRAAAAAARVRSGLSLDAFTGRTLGALGRLAAGRRVTAPRGESRPPVPVRPATPDPPGPFTVRAAPGGGLLLTRPGSQTAARSQSTPVLSGCLIVRDNAGTIRACLESLRPWVDELVVVDTGSTDDTPKIAAELGARVFHFPWVDDFSAARNESVRHARGAWVFWMDSDDVIDAANGRALRDLARGPHKDGVLGYVVRVHCPGPPGTDDLTAVDHVKLFRNRPELRFEHRIHEQILPAIRRAGGEVAWTDLFVVHAGYDHTPAGQVRKRDRDLRILHRELDERPGHPFTLFNLGMTYADVGEPGRAAGYLEDSLRHSDPGDSHRRKAHALLAYCRSAAGDRAGALGACESGLAECPEDLELRFRYGVLLHGAGRPREAVAAYHQVLAAPGDRYFASLDRGVAGFKAHQNLAAAHADLGEWAEAEAAWRAVVRDAPAYRAGWRGWGEFLVLRDRLAEADELARRLGADPALAVEGHVLAGRVAAARGDAPGAVTAWERAAAAAPADPEPLRLLARAHFDAGADEPAARVLRALTALDPNDPAAHHNLGAVLLRGDRAADAAGALRRSLELRPEAVETRVCLGYALRATGDRAGAASAWRGVLAAEPDHTEARAALDGLERPA